jgi:hypothetical protein
MKVLVALPYVGKELAERRRGDSANANRRAVLSLIKVVRGFH